jgi:hypothetical protein
VTELREPVAAALDTIPKGTGMSTEKVAELTGFPVHACLDALTAMEAQGLISRYGVYRTTMWRVRHPNPVDIVPSCAVTRGVDTTSGGTSGTVPDGESQQTLKK